MNEANFLMLEAHTRSAHICLTVRMTRHSRDSSREVSSVDMIAHVRSGSQNVVCGGKVERFGWPDASELGVDFRLKND